MPFTLPFPSFFTESGGPQPASQLDSNFAATNTSLTTEQPITASGTTDLGSVQSNNVLINFSASPTVSQFGSSAITSQPFFNIRWAGTGTATLQNSASILIAGGANLTINPNDQGKAIYLGGGNWAYAPASRGATASFPGSQTTLASSGTTDLGTAGSFLVNITGTTTITSFGSSAVTTAPLYFLTFAGILTLTYNATSLILPTSANITTAAGDSAVAEYNGSGNWTILQYYRKSGASLAGSSGVNNAQAFTSSGTWTKPASGTYAMVMLWGAGGSGGSNQGTGGGGGGYSQSLFLLSALTSTVTVTIGAGGASVTGNNLGNAGGNTTFGAFLTAYGGGAGGQIITAAGAGGSGGGSLSAGIGGNAGVSSDQAGGLVGGGIGIKVGSTTTPNAINSDGGGGGASGAAGTTSPASSWASGGGNAVNGGGGGGSSQAGQTVAGLSVYGGNGGAGATGTGNGVAGVQPGGGGGGNASSAHTSGAGGAGQCIVIVY